MVSRFDGTSSLLWVEREREKESRSGNVREMERERERHRSEWGMTYQVTKWVEWPVVLSVPVRVRILYTGQR